MINHIVRTKICYHSVPHGQAEKGSTLVTCRDSDDEDIHIPQARSLHLLLLSSLYDHCCCSWLYQVVINVLIIAVSLLVVICSILISVNIIP
jgi:hypothetical protein